MIGISSVARTLEPTRIALIFKSGASGAPHDPNTFSNAGTPSSTGSVHLLEDSETPGDEEALKNIGFNRPHPIFHPDSNEVMGYIMTTYSGIPLYISKT